MASNRRGFFQNALFWLTGGMLAGSHRDASGQEPQPSPITSPGPAQRLQPTQFVPDQDVLRRDYDLVVVGGGIAGTSAAISAARHGVKVALVHNRSMLGGNSSSEVKLFPENNSGHQPWIKEGGIHEEFHTEERVRNHRPYLEGTMNCHWDLVLYEWVTREPNIDLYLNTHMHRPIMRDEAHIGSVFCFQLGTEKTFELHAPLFVDATGDGYLGYRAGADFRWGQDENIAQPSPPPGKEDPAALPPELQVMGNTLMFTAIDTGRPVPFKRPEWAAEFPDESDLASRGHKNIEGGYWWIEVGAPFHPIADNDKITHEALRQLLGVWDHIKNKCPDREKAANYGLEFVGFWPYKRECRRLMGPYLLTQLHLQNPQPMNDAVAYGAWGIDIHTPGGIHNRHKIPYEPPRTDKNFGRLHTLPYGIPLRALYSRNIENLMMAGRPISCTYTAFASSRVLSTGSIVGQAVGVAAAMCKAHAALPREVTEKHIKQVQQLILRDDGHIPGVVNEDPLDLARRATATASSEAPLAFPEEPQRSRPLSVQHAQLFPVSTDRIEAIELMFYSRLEQPEKVTIGLRPARHVWDFRHSGADVATGEAEVPARKSAVWVRFPLDARVEPNRLYFVYVHELPARLLLNWKEFRDTDGEPNRVPIATTAADRPNSEWRPITGGVCFPMRVHPQQKPYGPQNVVTGTNRPDMWSNIWISDPAEELPAWLQLTWPKPVTFDCVHLTFDTDQNRRVTLPLFRYPDCVKDYDIQARTAGGWKKVAEVRDNYVRHRVHRFDRITTDALRIDVLATNGAASARVYQVRVYHEIA